MKPSNPVGDACDWPKCECSRGCEFGAPNKTRQVDECFSVVLAGKLREDLDQCGYLSSACLPDTD